MDLETENTSRRIDGGGEGGGRITACHSNGNVVVSVAERCRIEVCMRCTSILRAWFDPPGHAHAPLSRIKTLKNAPYTRRFSKGVRLYHTAINSEKYTYTKAGVQHSTKPEEKKISFAATEHTMHTFTRHHHFPPSSFASQSSHILYSYHPTPPHPLPPPDRTHTNARATLST